MIKSEYEQAIDILNSGEKGVTFRQAMLIGKYYKHQGMEVRKNLEKFIRSRVGEFNEVVYDEWIEKILSAVDKYSLKTMETIPITQKEIDCFVSIENNEARKLLFAMWVYGKYGLLNSKAKDRITSSIKVFVMNDVKELFELAKIPYSTAKYNQLSKILVDLGLISFSFKKNDAILMVDFMGDKVDEIPIDSDMVYYLYYLLGDKMVFKCQRCGKWSRKSSVKSTTQKYCSDCRKSIDREKDRLKKKEKR